VSDCRLDVVVAMGTFFSQAKGLQKLKFFCAICQKQCRDANGFKCHQESEAHLRQIEVFISNHDKLMDEFSSQFERNYLETLRLGWGERRVHANKVYNEYIKDKMHVHMNSTIWPTLTNFVEYLGKTGKCVIDETEEGWFVQYIDRDPEKLRRREEAEERARSDAERERRHRERLEEEALERAAALDVTRRDATEMDRSTVSELRLKVKPVKTTTRRTLGGNNPFGSDETVALTADVAPTADVARIADLPTPTHAVPAASTSRAAKRPRSPTDEGGWAFPIVRRGCMVRIRNAELEGGKFDGEKATVSKVALDTHPPSVTVRARTSGVRLRLPATQLETVVPRPGGEGLGLCGPIDGETVRVEAADVDRSMLEVAVLSSGRKFSNVPFGCVTKVEREG
jgi:DNA/RNA-binding protein KIN17